MKLVAVTRLRNDEDILEAFVQHHAAIVDHHIFLDNGSDGPAVQILSDLRAAGYALSAFRSPALTFAEVTQNTFLLQRAAARAADWVVFLDCDEFVDERHLGRKLRAHLATVAADVPGVSARLRNYLPTARDDAAEAIVPKRLCWRDPAPVSPGKVIVRADLARRGATVERGNHAVTLDGQAVAMLAEPGLALAHYPARTGWQMLAKALVGRLKVLAAGEAEAARGTSAHYTGVLAFLRAHPEALMRDHGYLTGRWAGDWLPADLVRDPLHYLGGSLVATPPADPAARAVCSVLAYLDEFAREQGRAVTEVPAAAAFAEDRATSFEPLFG